MERWAEDSGNAALMGRELPPDEVLAADQRITAWARELQAGRAGGRHGRAACPRLAGPAPGPGLPPPPGPATATRGRRRPAGFASRVTLTVPLATLTGLADRPGELAGLGPVDPWLARDLAAAAAANPKTTWCVTVTDEQGHAVGHGCARPEPKSHRQRAGPGPPDDTGFTFTPASRDGPPGGYGTWRLRTPGPGPDLIITLESLTTDPCDHRHEASGHDPGVRLQAPVPGPARHLHQPRLPPPRRPVRRRAQHPLRGRRTDLPLQHRPEMPPRPPAQAAPEMDRSTSSPTAPSDGPPHRGGPTPPNRPATRSNPPASRGRAGVGSLATAALPDVGLRDRFHSQHG